MQTTHVVSDPKSPHKQAQLRRTTVRTGEVTISLPRVGFDLLPGEIAQLYAVRTVDLLGNGSNLLFNGEVQVVEEFELGFALASSNECFCHFPRASPTLGPVIADDGSIRAPG